MRKIRRFKIIEAMYLHNLKNPEKIKYTRDSLCRKIKVNPAYLSKLNTGYEIPKILQRLYNVSELLECEIEDFYTTEISKTGNKLVGVDIKKMCKKNESTERFVSKLASTIGVGQNTFYYWKIGKNIDKSIVPFFNLCQTLGVTAKELIEV